MKQLEPGLELNRGEDGRQDKIDDHDRIDLLFKDSNDKFVINKIKRGLPDREAIGQVIQYTALVTQHLANGRSDKVRVILLGEAPKSTADRASVDMIANAGAIETKWYRVKLEFDG